MPDSVEEYAAKQAAEYGTYVANGPIYVGGALAFNTGHPVPVSSVARFDYLEQGLVRKAGEAAPDAPPTEQHYPQGAPIEVVPESDTDADLGTEQKD